LYSCIFKFFFWPIGLKSESASAFKISSTLVKKLLQYRNFYGRPALQCTAAIMFYSCSFFLFFNCRQLFSAVTERISLKLAHIVGYYCNFQMHIKNIGGASHKKMGAENMTILARRRNNFAT